MLRYRFSSAGVLVCRIVVAVLASVVVDVQAEIRYSYTDLGTFGGTSSQAYDINEAGDVTGWAWSQSEPSQEYDWETGLYNYRARIYDSDLGRFYSPDPAHEFFSPYTFVGNNPINRVDPSGTISLLGTRLLTGAISTLVYTGLGAGIGAGIGAAIGAAQSKSDLTDSLRQGALWGAVAGAGLGVLRTIAELTTPLRRGVQNVTDTAIIYDEHQKGGPFGAFDSGRVGAESIAERERISGQHLYSIQNLRTRQSLQSSPLLDYRRYIVVAHGGENDAQLWYYERVNNQRKSTAMSTLSFAGLLQDTADVDKIQQIDFCVCFAGKDGGFAKQVIEWLRFANPNITGWASRVPTTPIASLASMGTIRTADASAFGQFKEFLYDVFPFPVFRPGVRMPNHAAGPVGSWVKF